MRFILQILAIATLGYIAELYMSWWTIAVAAILGGYFLKSKANFLAGFLAIALMWLAVAVWVDAASPSNLADQVAAIFTLSKPLLLVVTCLLGGLVGGFGAWTGARLRPGKKRSPYY
mgnify:CR=1 FL=1